MNIRRTLLGALAVGVFAVVAVGFAYVQESHAAPGGCVCPMVYAPVKCDNGRTYSNLCVANCNKAKNCVPVIILPPPI
jgi:hypothetical protein